MAPAMAMSFGFGEAEGEDLCACCWCFRNIASDVNVLEQIGQRSCCSLSWGGNSIEMLHLMF